MASTALRKPASSGSDPESRLNDADHAALKLWLRLLTCTTLIERRIRAGLHRQFKMTLARFDLMAQLERAPEGLKMGELSRRLMVTGGNVTGLTDQLVAEGLVDRNGISGDLPAYAVRLTAKGKRALDAMGAEQCPSIINLLSGFPAAEREV